MKVLHTIEELAQIPGPVNLAIGVFDGLHLGHQAVIGRAMNSRTRARTVVMTFDPHPVRVLRPEKAPRLLTSTQHKIMLIEQLGVDAILVQKFDIPFSRTPPELFIESLFDATNQLQEICVGEGWTFGANRSGSVELLGSLAIKLGFELASVPSVEIGGKIVSSTLVRSAIERGDLDFAAKLLGRPFTILGTVAEGRQIGRSLGFPTANLRAHNEQFPPDGVYAARAWIRDEEFGGVVNIGVRPTVEVRAGERLLELHVFDFRTDIYGEDVQVEFLTYLRPERKFSGLSELKRQIARDADSAREIYRKVAHESNPGQGCAKLHP
ncbi:MAG: bifunctional riboflavin kinase/FAD synthetase [Verrucomicrobia bacterium]|nr:bifunctional riboflavin kinase/FAD synthetase [Verrucomicrobiota bacterium]